MMKFRMVACVALAFGILGMVPHSAAAKTVKFSDPGSVACATSDVQDALACLGPISGNDSEDAVSGAFDLTGWTRIAKVDMGSKGQGGSDRGLTVSDGGAFGSWRFSGDASLYSVVMVALKGGPTYSLYRLKDKTLSGLWFTMGIAKGNGKGGPDLSHFSLYGLNATAGSGAPIPVPAVPLPAAGYALIAGMGGLALLRRWRRAKA